MSTIDPEYSEDRLITSSHDLDDYDILATNLMSVAVPHETNESFRKMIWAAMVTYSLGNTSVDHVMRRYEFVWENRRGKSFQSDPRVVALRDVCEVVRQTADLLEEVHADSPGRICAKSALCRLEASFKAAYGLVRRHYVFETDAVVRMILEQLAWSYVVADVSEHKISRLRPNDCITPFKAFFSDCGKLYGFLSDGAHIDPSIAEHYAKFDREGLPPVRRSREDSFDSGENIAVLSVVYLRLVQSIFSLVETAQYSSRLRRLMELLSQYRERHIP